MLQILFAWSNEHLHCFHVFGKDYGNDSADTRHVTLNAFGFQQGERFRYVYNYYACDPQNLISFATRFIFYARKRLGYTQ
jgi:hypothetical protein